MEIKQQNTTQFNNWQMLLGSVFNTSVSITAETDTTLSIQTTGKTAGEIETILNSAAAIRGNLSYAIQKGDTPILPDPRNYSSLESFSNDGMAIFKSVFGQLLVKFGLTAENWQDNGRYLSAEIDPEFLESRRANVKALQGRLKAASLTDLQSAFLGEGAIKQPTDYVGIINKQTDKILYLTGEKIYFDYQLLCEFIFPPVLQTSSFQDNVGELSIQVNKKHLLAYLSSIFTEGFILHQDSPGSNVANLLWLSTNRSVMLPLQIYVMLDCSSSMIETWDDYIQNIKNFIAEIRKIAAELGAETVDKIMIKFIPFGHKSLFNLANLKTFALLDVAGQNDFLHSLAAMGETYLTGAILKTLQESLLLLANNNVTLVIFTDGQDNNSAPSETEALQGEVQEFRRMVNPPQMFAFGFGDYLDEDFLQKLADKTGACYKRLEDQQSFDAVLGEIAKMVKARELVEIIYNLTENDVTRYFSAYEGEITQAPDKVQVPGSFSVNQVSYTVVPTDSKKLAWAPTSTSVFSQPQQENKEKEKEKVSGELQTASSTTTKVFI